jgi:hypothetical protein
MGADEAKLHKFLMSAPDGVEWSAPHYDPLISVEKRIFLAALSI